MTFDAFPKVPRLSREIVITEKIDGTNAAVVIVPREEGAALLAPIGSPLAAERTPIAVVGDYYLFAQSRTRLIQPGKTTDNHGFAAWVRDNAEELVKLGPGRHFGEWWGRGIQRGYSMPDRVFSLFNVGRWVQRTNEDTNLQCLRLTEGMILAPACCRVVPVLYRGMFGQSPIQAALKDLEKDGSRAAPGFMDPEGIMIYHTAANQMFKKTIKGDESPKGQQ